jgi:hypothetical protein
MIDAEKQDLAAARSGPKFRVTFPAGTYATSTDGDWRRHVFAEETVVEASNVNGLWFTELPGEKCLFTVPESYMEFPSKLPGSAVLLKYPNEEVGMVDELVSQLKAEVGDTEGEP